MFNLYSFSYQCTTNDDVCYQGHGSGPGPGGFLYTWDGGNQLTYPVKYHDIGYKEPPPMVMPYNTIRNPTRTIIHIVIV